MRLYYMALKAEILILQLNRDILQCHFLIIFEHGLTHLRFLMLKNLSLFVENLYVCLRL